MRAALLFGVACALAAPCAPGAEPSPRLLERAEQIAGSRCFLCHGADGEVASDLFPRLAGQHSEYLVKQLRDFRSRERRGQMNELVQDLKDDEIVALGVLFSRKAAGTQPASDRSLASLGGQLYRSGDASSGVPSCAICHGPSARGTATLPRLAGQPSAYAIRRLTEFSRRPRTADNAAMHEIAAKLTAVQLKALAEYLSELD